MATGQGDARNFWRGFGVVSDGLRWEAAFWRDGAGGPATWDERAEATTSPSREAEEPAGTLPGQGSGTGWDRHLGEQLCWLCDMGLTSFPIRVRGKVG